MLMITINNINKAILKVYSLLWSVLSATTLDLGDILIPL